MLEIRIFILDSCASFTLAESNKFHPTSFRRTPCHNKNKILRQYSIFRAFRFYMIIHGK